MYQTQLPTDIHLGTDAQTNPTPRGELSHHDGAIGGMDARLGVPVPIGARVWAGEVEGILVGATDQLAIIRDDQGLQHAERWGVVTVQASGPAQAALSSKDTPAPTEPGLLSISAEQLGQIEADPYRRAALRALDLLAFIDSMREQIESIEDDRTRAADQAADLEALLGQIADNRARHLVESGVSA